MVHLLLRTRQSKLLVPTRSNLRSLTFVFCSTFPAQDTPTPVPLPLLLPFKHLIRLKRDDWVGVARVVPILSADMGYARRGLQEREWGGGWGQDGNRRGCEKRVLNM